MAGKQATKPEPYLRRLRKQDVLDLAEISMLSFEPPFEWEKDEFQRVLRKSRHLCIGVDVDEAIRAFLVCQVGDESLQLLHAATHPDFRRRGFISQLLVHVRDLVDSCRVDFAEAYVQDKNLGAQLCLHRNGFRAKSVVKSDAPVDHYLMRYETLPSATPMLEAGDRISG